jgi:predicted TIM-barrel fold metal-dependent hydrolase
VTEGSVSFPSLSDDDLPGLAAELGIPGIFDVHVHFMAPQVMAKVWAYFDNVGPKVGRPWPITYRGDDDERVAQLRRMGVRRFTALSYAHKPGVAGFMNDWTRDFAARTPEALWSATFYPEPEAATYVPELVSGGVEVFKAHMQVGDFAADDPLLDPVWAALEESETPIVLHAGSGPAPGLHTGPQSVERVLTHFPRLRLIITHLGTPEVDEFLALAERFDELRLDLTMAFTGWFGEPLPERLPTHLQELRDRILFGSDFPNLPYPYAHQVAALLRMEPGDDWMRAILWQNAATLFGGTDDGADDGADLGVPG